MAGDSVSISIERDFIGAHLLAEKRYKPNVDRYDMRNKCAGYEEKCSNQAHGTTKKRHGSV